MSDRPPSGWSESGTEAATWFKRFEFSDYPRLRRFLDGLAELAEQTGVHPDNIGFGKDYANVTLAAPAADDERARLTDFVTRLNTLAEGN